jgi:hypothetical protein
MTAPMTAPMTASFPIAPDATVAKVATSRIKYLSPSSVNLWLSDRSRFINQYILGLKEPQTDAMLLGLAVDGILKARMGGPALDVSLPSRVIEDALYCVQEYDRLMEGRCIVDATWTFEASLLREIDTPSGRVVISGKPDAYKSTVTPSIILDWKVNGFYSRAKLTSPKAGYMYIAPEGASHRGFEAGYIHSPKGSEYNSGVTKYNLNGIHKEWELQMWMYGLLVFGSGGAEAPLCRIEQLTFDTRVSPPSLRISVHQALVPALNIDLRSIWDEIMQEYDKRGVK